MVAAISPVGAASISVQPIDAASPTLVSVVGDIESTDGEQFQRKTASLSRAIVALASDGGSVVAGIEIGEQIRLKNFITLVPENERCASACALAWLGGTQRFMGQRGLIGFHAAYNASSGEETGVGNALVGAYLTRIGLPYDAVVYITQATPNSMTWLTLPDAERHGIDVTLLPKTEAATQNARVSASQSNLSNRAVDFVTSLLATWSQSDVSILPYLLNAYDDAVSYYGAVKTRQEVAADKQRFMMRWPDRKYMLRPGTISSTCDEQGLTCTVNGIVDWQTASPARRAASAGIATFQYKLLSTGNSFKILGESGSALRRPN